MAVVLLTAPIEGAPFHRAHSGSRRSTQPSHHHNFFRTSFHSFATFALHGAIMLSGSDSTRPPIRSTPPLSPPSTRCLANLWLGVV